MFYHKIDISGLKFYGGFKVEYVTNPFDEDDSIEYVQTALTVYCPYCKSDEVIAEDWHHKYQMWTRLYVDWECQECLGTFETEHRLNDQGLLDGDD
jgi:hypothetical protein